MSVLVLLALFVIGWRRWVAAPAWTAPRSRNLVREAHRILGLSLWPGLVAAGVAWLFRLDVFVLLLDPLPMLAPAWVVAPCTAFLACVLVSAVYRLTIPLPPGPVGDSARH